jgi:protein-disulfide isomerase
MKTADKKNAVSQENPQAKKQQPSEKTENIVALAIFALLILIGVAIFTKGFGLFGNDLNAGQRVKVPPGDDPYRGSTNASVVIYVFSDFECPNCKVGELRMNAVLQKFPGKWVYIFKNYPLISIHPYALNASLAAMCANEQGKFWEYHDYLFEHNTELGASQLEQYAKDLGLDSQRFNECFESQRYKGKIDSDIKTGSQIGVPGTPTFFINGLPVIGAKSEDEYTRIISEELKK